MKILTVANRAPHEPYFCFQEFWKSAARYGHEPIILGWQQPWKGLMTKPNKYYEYLLSREWPDEPIILCDAWDIIFAADPHEIKWPFLPNGAEIIWNAEKNLFPDPTLDFPETETSYRYLNSGFAIGFPSAFKQMFAWMDLDVIGYDREENGKKIEPNDQLYIQHSFLQSGIPMTLDSRCNICQTLHGVTENELDFSEDRIRNVETGTYPLVFHCNGQKEIWKDKILAKLNL